MGLTVSSFGPKASPSATFGKQKSKSTRISPRFPTYPNEKATGLIQGQKIQMKEKPANHNILGELDLKKHFLKKLHELRYMKEEYYGQPMEKIDPLEVLAEA